MACHLTFEERQFLYRLNQRDVSKAEIARLMGRDRSTIYRELERNSGGGCRTKRFTTGSTIVNRSGKRGCGAAAVRRKDAENWSIVCVSMVGPT